MLEDYDVWVSSRRRSDYIIRARLPSSSDNEISGAHDFGERLLRGTKQATQDKMIGVRTIWRKRELLYRHASRYIQLYREREHPPSPGRSQNRGFPNVFEALIRPSSESSGRNERGKSNVPAWQRRNHFDQVKEKRRKLIWGARGAGAGFGAEVYLIPLVT